MAIVEQAGTFWRNPAGWERILAPMTEGHFGEVSSVRCRNRNRSFTNPSKPPFPGISPIGESHRRDTPATIRRFFPRIPDTRTIKTNQFTFAIRIPDEL